MRDIVSCRTKGEKRREHHWRTSLNFRQCTVQEGTSPLSSLLSLDTSIAVKFPDSDCHREQALGSSQLDPTLQLKKLKNVNGEVLEQQGLSSSSPPRLFSAGFSPRRTLSSTFYFLVHHYSSLKQDSTQPADGMPLGALPSRTEHASRLSPCTNVFFALGTQSISRFRASNRKRSQVQSGFPDSCLLKIELICA